MRGKNVALLTALLAGCTAAPIEEAVAQPVAAPEVAPAAAVVAAPAQAPPATGSDECDPLALACVRAIASRQEEDRTLVYITPAEERSARPGQWVARADID